MNWSILERAKTLLDKGTEREGSIDGESREICRWQAKAEAGLGGGGEGHGAGGKEEGTREGKRG